MAQLPDTARKRFKRKLLDFKLSQIFLRSVCLSRGDLLGTFQATKYICGLYAHKLRRVKHSIIDDPFRPDTVRSGID